MLINFLKYSFISFALTSNLSEMNIVETAVSNDNFSTLVAAVQAGELVDALLQKDHLQYLHLLMMVSTNYLKVLLKHY
mgnify:CR=1 FL=1